MWNLKKKNYCLIYIYIFSQVHRSVLQHYKCFLAKYFSVILSDLHVC